MGCSRVDDSLCHLLGPQQEDILRRLSVASLLGDRWQDLFEWSVWLEVARNESADSLEGDAVLTAQRPDILQGAPRVRMDLELMDGRLDLRGV